MSELKECCTTCKFPLGLPRELMILDNNFVTLFSVEENTCAECGHQKDGSTIKIVSDTIKEINNRYIKQREEIISFLFDYHYLIYEQRREICTRLYNAQLNVEEPYSWNVVYHELINGTKLGLILVRDRIKDSK